jgi:CRP-like cAMP-binding protein
VTWTVTFPLLLDLPLPYTARALSDARCLFLNRDAFERLLATRPAISRRWLSSVAQRVSAGQARLVGLLGRPLPAQLAQLLLDEAVDARVELAQRTIAAMLGVQRPSINKILKEFERDRLITVGYAVIELTGPDGLRTRAGCLCTGLARDDRRSAPCAAAVGTWLPAR